MMDGGGGMDWGKVGDWISGVVDRGRDDYWRDRNEGWQEHMSNTQYGRQKEFAQMGIQWRVNDAIAAGVHPLYALGAGGAAFSSPGFSVGEGANAAPVTGSALGKWETKGDREVRFAQMNALHAAAERDAAQGAYYASEAARNYQALNGGPRTLLDPDSKGTGGDLVTSMDQQFAPGNVGAVKMTPSEAISSVPGDPSTAAAKFPAGQYVVIGGTAQNPVQLWMPHSPGEGPWETWGELDWATKLAFLRMNQLRDEDFGKKMWNLLVHGGKTPLQDDQQDDFQRGVQWRAESFRRRNNVR